MSASAPMLALPTLNCWNEIGIAGDRSCPELAEVIHCRNCKVFARAAKGFFDRSAPAGYLQEWSDQLAKPLIQANRDTLSLLVFRLGQEWFGIRSQVVVEVTTPRPVHSIPHRKSEVLEGMVNLRGQLQLQISLKHLFGAAGGGDSGESRGGGTGGAAIPRLLVLKRDGETWVAQVDEVVEVRRYSKDMIRPVPSTLANFDYSFSQAVILSDDRTLGFLDDARLFSALRDLQG